MGRFKNEINNRIQDELNKIRYYYSYRDVLVQASKFCGENEIVEKIRMYNSFIVKAPIRLYHLYYEFYICGHSNFSLANKLSYSTSHISRLHRKLIHYFAQSMGEE